MSDEGVEEISKNLRSLDTLYLGGNKALTEKSMIALCSLDVKEPFCLESSLCVNFVNSVSISILGKSKLGMFIQSLDFTECVNFEDSCCYPIAQSCLYLKWLSLSKTKITDFGIAQLCHPKRRGLRILDLLNLTDTFISERSVLCLLQNHPKLTKLYLASCTEIEGKG